MVVAAHSCSMEITTPDIDSDKMARASFDLTDFGSAETFVALLREAGLTQHKGYAGDGFEWHGFGESVVVHTYANPITGENSIERPPEKGYASFIHIQGDKYRVEEVFELIAAVATYMKGGSKTAWIV